MSNPRLRLLVTAIFLTTSLTGCGGNQQSAQQPAQDSSQVAQAPPVSAPVFTPAPVADATRNDDDEETIAPGSEQDVSFDPPPVFFQPQPTDKPLPLFTPPPLEEQDRHRVKKLSKGGKPAKFERTKIGGIPAYKLVLDLDDPQTLITVALPNGAHEANSATISHGDESFDSFNKRCNAAMMANGTFFSKDEEKRVMGNMVTEGEFRKYSQWENYGTTFGIKADNQLEMVTARAEGQPNWSDYWFSITCGPRLVKAGQISIDAANEGFQDSHVFTIGPRAAIGFNREKRQIIYCAFLRGLSLEREAELMKQVGCDEAMNLDGGASRALSADGKVILKPGRALTNVLVFYDTKHPAPPAVAASWNRFQEGARPQVPSDVAWH